MKRKTAKGLAAAGPISSAANEEFTAAPDGVEGPEERPQPGWNPFDVWRTRVKSSESSSVTPEHEPDPFH
jgi:hypothetical protein